jgi:hypothetical protein
MSEISSPVTWLLDPVDSDPSIRWQTMRDLLDLPESEWAEERSDVETKGWGSRLLAFQDDDGQWAGGAYNPADYDWEAPEAQRSPGGPPVQPWTATTHTLSQLRDMGLDPSSESARKTAELIGKNARWEYDDLPYWAGEVEPCVNGVTVANGAYLGVDVSPIVERLVSERLEDGGWNCEAENGSTRSSFDTTINVLEGLLEYERATGGTPESSLARSTGEEYLLQRSLYRRLSNGEPIERFMYLINPSRWYYHVIRALDYFRAASNFADTAPDPRLAAAIEYIRSRRLDDGSWPLDWNPLGRVWFEVDEGEGQPSRWLTLKASRVLKWWES